MISHNLEVKVVPMPAYNPHARDAFKPVPFYFINTVDPALLSAQAIFSAVETLKINGFGGCVVFNKPPDGFSADAYLGEAWFEMVKNFAEAGQKLDMRIWINDGFDFPPGDAGGRINPATYPELTQLRLRLDKSGQVEVTKVDWGFPAFEEPDSSRLFIELVYEQYHKRLGHYFGNGITGFFSDADNRRYNHFVRQAMGDEIYFPWSRGFSTEFKQKYGYEVEPHLENIIKGEAEASVARDYWKLAGELYTRWFRNNYEWCRANNLLYSFHTSDTGPFTRSDCPRSSLFTEGAFLHQARFCDYPGTDHELLALDGGTHFDSRYYTPSVSWGAGSANLRHPDFNVTKWDLRAKYTASAAYLHGRDRALCEAFAATNWSVTYQDLRRIAAWQIMQGINFFVPHAVHHQFYGQTKYFAPPEFLSGSLKYGLSEFNHALTEMCFVASQGELADPVAVLDPTEAVWLGQSHCLFDLCDRLNRLPVNYVIADQQSLREQPERFRYLLLPSIDIASGDLAELLNRASCVVLNQEQLSDVPLPDISFDGGELHYMLRRLDNGTEMLLAANIWSDRTLSGTLRFKGKLFQVELAAGEIAIFNGPFEQYRKPRHEIPRLNLPATMPVTWESDNMIPVPVSRKFEFYNEIHLPNPYVLLPPGAKLRFDGKAATDGEPVRLFDDEYFRVNLQDGGKAGHHALELYGNSLESWQNVYLCGDFDAAISTENDFYEAYTEFYNLKIYLPEKFKVTLRKRSSQLHPGNWSSQGAPFYYGQVTYHISLEHKGGIVRLNLGAVNGTCSLRLNGNEQGSRIWEPFEYDLELEAGINHLEITVNNTMAGLLEYHQCPGGINNG